MHLGLKSYLFLVVLFYQSPTDSWKCRSMAEILRDKQAAASQELGYMHPFGLHERDVTYFGFKFQQGYECGSCHRVSCTLCSQLLDFHIHFYVAVPFQIQSGSICVLLHQDSCCKVWVEGYSTNLCHFTCPPCSVFTFWCFLGGRDLLGN